MRKFGCLPSLLVASGILSILALAFPQLIVLGLFVLIVPGLVLAFAPTAFCYLSLFSFGWYGAKRLGPVAGAIAGLALAAAIGIIPAKIANIQSAKAIAKVQLLSLRPDKPIPLPEHVTILQPSYSQRYKNINSNETNCDDLCLTLLYGGTAKSVTMGTSQLSAYDAKTRGNAPPVTYTLLRKKGCQSEQPIELSRWSGWKNDETVIRLLFAVRLRIANGDCLVARPSAESGSGFQLVFLESTIPGSAQRTGFEPPSPKVRTLEIRNQEKLVARAVDVEASEFSIPAILVPEEHGFKIGAWRLARRPYLNAESIQSVARLRQLAGWSIDFPTTGIKGAS